VGKAHVERWRPDCRRVDPALEFGFRLSVADTPGWIIRDDLLARTIGFLLAAR
jgi:hypothetical protein